MGELFELVILAYFLLMNSTYSLLVAISGREIFRQLATRRPEVDSLTMSEWSTPPITIIAAAHNESLTIVDSVHAFLNVHYPRIQVVVVNDGSTDETLEILKDTYDLHPSAHVQWKKLPTQTVRGIYGSRKHLNLTVIDKENGGKADALNAGLNAARSPLVCCVDSDTLIERTALLRMVGPFFHEQDRVLAVGGTLRLANGCVVKNGRIERLGWPKSWLARFQTVEYMRAFLFGRMGLNVLRGGLIVSGAFSMFDRDVVMEVGGYRTDTVGEDMELVVRMHRRMREKGIAYQIPYIAEPICYTEAPEKLGDLGRQRDRWQRGLCDSLWRHRKMLLNPKYGATGMVTYPMFLALELFGPIVELAGYVWFCYCLTSGRVNAPFATMFAGIAFLWGFLISAQAILLESFANGRFEGKKLNGRLLLTAMVEPFVYRPVMVYYRLRGTLNFIRGSKQWGAMSRKGFREHPDSGGIDGEGELVPEVVHAQREDTHSGHNHDHAANQGDYVDKSEAPHDHAA